MLSGALRVGRPRFALPFVSRLGRPRGLCSMDSGLTLELFEQLLLKLPQLCTLSLLLNEEAVELNCALRSAEFRCVASILAGKLGIRGNWSLTEERLSAHASVSLALRNML